MAKTILNNLNKQSYVLKKILFSFRILNYRAFIWIFTLIYISIRYDEKFDKLHTDFIHCNVYPENSRKNRLGDIACDRREIWLVCKGDLASAKLIRQTFERHFPVCRIFVYLYNLPQFFRIHFDSHTDENPADSGRSCLFHRSPGFLYTHSHPGHTCLPSNRTDRHTH